MSYIKNLTKLVCKKYRYKQEPIEEWFAKYTASKRNYLKKLWEHDPHCVYCGRETLEPTMDNEKSNLRATYEHKTPLSKGGTDHRSNIALSCSRCNNLKRDMYHEEFISFIDDKDKIDETIQKIKTTSKIKSIEKRLREGLNEKEKIRHQNKIFYLAIMLFDDKVKKQFKEIQLCVEESINNKTSRLRKKKQYINNTYGDLIKRNQNEETQNSIH